MTFLHKMGSFVHAAHIIWPSLLVIFFHTYGQDLSYFETISQEDGLSSDFVTFIANDHQGFVWIATQNGLNRYDGYDFTIFRHAPDDPYSLSGNYVAAILEDSQKRLWIGTDNGLDLLNRQSGKFERLNLFPTQEDAITVEITCLMEDSNERLWVGTSAHGLFRLERYGQSKRLSIEQYTHQPDVHHSLAANRISEIREDKQGNLWLGTSQGLNQLDPESGEVERFFPKTHIKGIQIDQNENIIFSASLHGIYLLDSTENIQLIPERTQDFRDTSLAKPFFSTNLEDLLLSSRGELWVGTDIGLFRSDPTSGVFTHFYHASDQVGTLSMNDVSCLFEDSNGWIWIGTIGGGVSRWDGTAAPFHYISHKPSDPHSISAGHIRAIREDDYGNLWISIVNKGLNKLVFDQHKGWTKSKHMMLDSLQTHGLATNSLWAIIKDSSGKLWMGGLKSTGLNCLDPKSDRFELFQHDPEDPQTLSSNNIGRLYADSNGGIWAGTLGAKGLNYLDTGTGKVKRYEHHPQDSTSISNNRVFAIAEDRAGSIWVGTFDGLNKLNKDIDQFERFYHDPNDPRSLSNNWALTLWEDREGRMWVGTNQGLNCYDPETNSFERFYEKDGLPSDRIHGILEDNLGYLWISTDRGLVRVDKMKDSRDKGLNSLTFRVFDHKDGLGGGSLWEGVYSKGEQTGHLYWGTSYGFNIVYPDRIQPDPVDLQFMLSTVTRFRDEKDDVSVMKDYFIADKEELELTHRDRVITFEFTDLDYQKSGRYQYEYQLSGLHNQWFPLVNERSITLSDLPRGSYDLILRGVKEGDMLTEETRLIHLIVHPPWWTSWWAYVIYAILVLSFLYGAYRIQLSRQLEIRESKRLKELDRFKSRLYTNITHEFRTPLTVILGLAEDLEFSHNVHRSMRAKLNLIRRNGNNLVNLINQILDLSKLDKNELKANYIRNDIVKYIRYITESFHSLAHTRNILLQVASKRLEVIMDYDPEKLRQIVSNLLANAIKFTPSGGKVRVAINSSSDASGTYLVLIVSDTGVGISEEELPHIFDRFYQSEGSQSKAGGTGIGLALTYELIKLLEGSISVKSKKGAGTTFTVTLPVSQNANLVPLSELPKPSVSNPLQTPLGSKSTSSAQLLLIEDNADVVEYMTTFLEEHYQLDFAYNGQAGIEKALENIPDIIISDVMMPEKDGFEVCETLKNDLRTSHIPIVLLTAKVDVDSRIAGLKRGADAYMQKPFRREELRVLLENLLSLRRKLQEKYSNVKKLEELSHSKPESQTVGLNDLEDAFLLKLRNFVEEHIDDPKLSTEKICRHMGMSRTNLHRKLKALTNHSLTYFIRHLRLHEAETLLLTTSRDISEIAYLVGFSDPKYFSRVFAEVYKQSPSEFRRK